MYSQFTRLTSSFEYDELTAMENSPSLVRTMIVRAGCGAESCEVEDMAVLSAWVSSENTLLVETVDMSLVVVEIVDRESAGFNSFAALTLDSMSVMLSTDSEL